MKNTQNGQPTEDLSSLTPSTCSHLVNSSVLERVNESPYVRDYRESSRVAMWLNLIWLDKSLARSQDQQARVCLPLLRQDVYDKLESDLGLLGRVKAKLQQLYPDSFLFRLTPEQIEVVDYAPLPISPSHFEEMCRQILSVRSLDEIAEGTSLAVTAHKIWLQTQGHSLSNTTNWELEHDYDRFRKESALLEGSIFFENAQAESSALAD